MRLLPACRLVGCWNFYLVCSLFTVRNAVTDKPYAAFRIDTHRTLLTAHDNVFCCCSFVLLFYSHFNLVFVMFLNSFFLSDRNWLLLRERKYFFVVNIVVFVIFGFVA